MASWFWVGGTGTWDASSTTHWALSSGGAGGAGVPTINDTATFDNNSGGGVVTFSATAVVNSIVNVQTGVFTGTLSLGVAWTNANFGGNITWRTGTLTTNNNNITVGNFDSSGGSGSATLNLGTSTVTVVSGSFQSNTTTALNSASASLVLQGNGTVSYLTNGAATWANFTYAPSAATSSSNLSVGTNLTVTGTLTLTGADAPKRILVQSNTLGTARTITCNGTVTASYVDFQDITGAGSASWNLSSVTGGSGDCGGNSGITFTAGATNYAVGVSASASWSAIGWASTSGGTAGTGRVPLPQDTAIFDANSVTATGRTITIDALRVCGTFDCSAVTNAPAFTSANTTESFYGSVTLGAISGSFCNPAYMQLQGRGSYNLNPNGAAVLSGPEIIAPGGTYTLLGNLNNTPSGTGRAFAISAGTFNAGPYNIAADYILFALNASLARTLNMGSGTWTLSMKGAVLSGSTTNLTLNAQTSTIYVSDTSTTAKTFAGAGFTYGTLQIAAGGTGAISITGANTFTALACTGSKTITFPATSTTTILPGGWQLDGTSGNILTVNSSSSGTAATISVSSGNVTFNYGSLQDNAATGGATFNYPSTTSVVSNVTGWNSIPSSGIYLYQQASGSSAGAASIAVSLGTNEQSGDFLSAVVGLPTGTNVSSITDTESNRWIQAATSDTSGGNAEIWYTRGVKPGSNVVNVSLSNAASVSVNVSEWSGVYSVDPLDQWSQNTGTSASPTVNTLTPRQNGELFIAATSAGASVSSSPPSGWTALTEPNASLGYAAAYQIQSGSVAVTGNWNSSAASTWAVAAACFVPGASSLNPQLQFPETLVEISTTNNYLAPLQGTGVWTNVSSYIQNMSLGPTGRQHELDRVQAAPAQFLADNRSGVFNPWNSSSFLYNGGNGLKPMNPLKVTAAWSGITYPVYYGYLQSVTTQITDVLNVDAQIQAYDIFQLLALNYLNNDIYAPQILTDGGSNLAAFYHLGDAIGSTSVTDSSGNGNTGSLISGSGGEPAFGAEDPFLYDPSTSLDLTNGTNAANGGFTTTDNLTEPPTVHNPLGSASVWAFECWAKWTAQTAPIGSSIGFNGLATTSQGGFMQGQGWNLGLAVGDLLIGSANELPTGTVITGLYEITSHGQQVTGIYLNNTPVVNDSTYVGYTAYAGGAPNVLFSANTQNGGTAGIGIGQFTSASVTRYNTVTVGSFAGGVLAPSGGSFAQDLQDGSWHYVAVNYAASVASIYVDGAFDSNQNVTNWTNPSVIAIGCYSGPQWGWAGTISHVALYSKNLTAGQIANHYNLGVAFQTQEYGASVGSWQAGRFNKVLQVSELDPTDILTVPYPFRTLMYAETNSLTSVTALNYMQTLTETEPGLIFQLPNGMIAAYSRQYQYLNPSSVTSQVTLADSASASVHYNGPGLQITGDDLDVWNDIQVQSARSGAAPQNVSENNSTTAARSASVYGHRTLQGLSSLQQEYDSDALAIAENYLEWYNQPLGRVTQVILDSFAAGGNNIPHMLGRGLYDQVTTTYNGQTPGPAFNQSSLIESISHQVDMSGPIWATTWALSPYELLLTPFIFGNNTQSQLGGAASVTGSGTSWVMHAASVSQGYLSGTVTFTVAAGSTSVAYNATASTCQTALAALVPGTTCSGGPINNANLSVTFGSSQSSFTATFSPSCVLTL